MSTSPRNFALDNLRGLMMWLGIVLHVAVNHMAAPSLLPWRDSQTSVAADLIFMSIHAFRMPAFFILAGFFVAGMIERRGHIGMLKNRLRRIGLPFVIFWPILAVLTACLVLMFAHVMQRGVIGFDPDLLPPRPAGQSSFGRLHLWFMLDLIWLYGLTALVIHLRRYMPGEGGPLSGALARRLVSTWLGLVILTVPLALIGASYPHGILTPTASFIPNLPELAHFGLFYAAGFAMYAHREHVLGRFEKTCGRNALAGLVTFIVSLAVLKAAGAPDGAVRFPDLSAAFFYSCTAWFWSVALIGAFSKYTRHQTPWLSYLSESSYWVYLVHMLGTIGFGILLYNAPLGAMAKMAINIVATTVACLLTYHWFVRRSAIGVLLNGRRVERLETALVIPPLVTNRDAKARDGSA